MSKRCLLLGSLWFAASCSLYDEQPLPTYELWDSKEPDGGQTDAHEIDELTPRGPALSFDAGADAAGSGNGEAGRGPLAGRGGAGAGAAAAGGGDAKAGGGSNAQAGAAAGGAGAGGAGVGGSAAAGSGGAGSGAGGSSAAGSGGAGSKAGSGGSAAAGSGGAGSGGSAAGGTGGSTANPNCPESGGQTWSGNGHCYFPLTAQASWNVSRDNCNQKNAKLVTITSLDEQTFVVGLLGSTPSWIGLSKFGAPQFSWTTGETLSYTNWAGGEPNLTGEAAAAIRNDTHKWFDDAVSANHPAICER